MGALLYAYAVERHALWQACGNMAFPTVHRQRFALAEQATSRERGDVLIYMPAIETGHDLTLQQRVECFETHHATPRRVERTFDRYETTIAMAVIFGRPGELGLIGESVCRSKLHHAREIAHRGGHSLEYLDCGGLEREDDGLAGRQREIASRLGGHGGHQLDATHVGAHMDARAAVLDRHPRHTAGEDVARGGGQRLEADENVGRRYGEHGGGAGEDKAGTPAQLPIASPPPPSKKKN